MTMRLGVALAGAIALAVPAAATAAPALDPLKPCYVSYRVDPVSGDAETEAIALGGSGFTPNALVNVTVDGVTAATNVPVDANGNLPAGATVQAPLQESGSKRFTITVSEQDNSAQSASQSALVSALS